MKSKLKSSKRKVGKGRVSVLKKIKLQTKKIAKKKMQTKKLATKKLKVPAKKIHSKKMKAQVKKIAKQKIKAHHVQKSGKKVTIPAKQKVLKMKAKTAAKTHQTQKPVAKAVTQKKPLATPPLEVRKPKVLVLSGFGLNSEAELAHAFNLAGAEASVVHFSDISSGAVKLETYQIFAIPGGWAFGDDIAGGKVLANKLKTTFRQQFEQFAASGKPIIGVCNGFQVLVKLGALPNAGMAFSQEATLEHNASGRFEDRWVYLKPQKSVCKYFEGVDFIQCPVRHGEGRFIAKDETALQQLEKKGFVVVKYTDEKLGDSVPYPQNPNGSPRGIAGICDSTGKIFGLMPHPECSVRKHTFPRWTAGISHEKNSLRFFENIVKEGKKYM